MTLGTEVIDIQSTMHIEIGMLSLVGSPRLCGEDLDHVEALAASQEELPPILVHRPTMRVIDGLHRVRAARLRGADTIAARFFDGPEDEAFVLAVKSNVTHGLPLSLADRKHAAKRIIGSHPRWSDRMIAAVTGLSAATVGDIRRAGPDNAVPENSRIGRDGRVRPLDGSQGRRIASELIKENPNLSLRQIARAAGISHETARDVKNRLRCGEDPLVPRRRKGREADAGKPADEEPVNPARLDRILIQQNARSVERLCADPALRFTETGRDLLRLLTMHSISVEEWERIVDSVPPHCRTPVSQLAKGCAAIWVTLALQLELRVAELES